MKSNKTDDLFRRGLKDLRHEPSAEAWEKLSANLNNNKRVMYWKWAGIAASLLIFGMAATLLMVNLQPTPIGIVTKELDTTGLEKESVESPFTSEDNIIEQETIDLATIERPIRMKDLGEANQDTSDQFQGIATSKRADIQSQPDRAEVDDIHYENKSKTEVTKLSAETLAGDVSDENLSPMIAEEVPVLEENGMQSTVKAESVPIRIVYKKGKSESLLASNEKNIVKKSFEKIGEITEDMKFSEERKARWRNTRDNILAFNIDQLFNNTNEEESEEIEP